MPNAIVRAAAEGMPNSSRRAFLTTSVAACAAVVASPAIPAVSDAVFAAIAAFRQANAAWQESLEACGVADRTLQAENAIGFAAIKFDMAGTEIRFQTNDEISGFMQAMREDCEQRGVIWDAEAMDRDDKGLRERLKDERERVELLRSRANADALEARQETACDLACRRAEAVLRTVPTTLAGLHAFADLMAEMAEAECFLTHHEDTSRALATLAKACRSLAPLA